MLTRHRHAAGICPGLLPYQRPTLVPFPRPSRLSPVSLLRCHSARLVRHQSSATHSASTEHDQSTAANSSSSGHDRVSRAIPDQALHAVADHPSSPPPAKNPPHVRGAKKSRKPPRQRGNAASNPPALEQSSSPTEQAKQSTDDQSAENHPSAEDAAATPDHSAGQPDGLSAEDVLALARNYTESGRHGNRVRRRLMTIANTVVGTRPLLPTELRLIRKVESGELSLKRKRRPSGPSRLVRKVLIGPNFRKVMRRVVRKAALDGPPPSVEPMSLKEAMKGSSAVRHRKYPEFVLGSDFDLTPLAVEQPAVPRLQHGLDRVLFNKGVYQLQDPHTMVYNFDPYLAHIMPVAEFDFAALAEYKTSSQDHVLSAIAKDHGIKYVGSTSSMTSSLAHFHYLLSSWRPISMKMLSKGFPETANTFTAINRVPNAMFLRYKNGVYAIDADKQYDGANIMMMLGKSMEKLLTMSPSEFERYRKSDPRPVTDAQRNAPESYHYSTLGDFLMRSQLDAHDPRLPGTGMFDLKTRAAITVRMQSDDYEEMSGYELHKLHGRYESFEREFYDMMRSTMLKYSLQARMGRMDGIFVAYHNVKRIFGFQYLSLEDMDTVLHGQSDRTLGDQEFSLSITLMNKILNQATERFPEQSLRFHFETRPTTTDNQVMYIFAEPMSEDEIDEIQNSQKAKIAAFERIALGMEDTASAGPEDEDQPSTGSELAKVETGTSKITDPGSVATAPSTEPEAEEGSVVAVDPAGSGHSLQTPIIVCDNDVPSATDNVSRIEDDKSSASKQEDKIPLRPLIALKLSIRSNVNKQDVTRPVMLEADDKWEVQYAMEEIADPNRAWANYEACKARRRKPFEKLGRVKKDNDNKDKTDDQGDDKVSAGEESRTDSSDRFFRSYVAMLRGLSDKGRELRRRIDELEAGRENRVRRAVW